MPFSFTFFSSHTYVCVCHFACGFYVKEANTKKMFWNFFSSRILIFFPPGSENNSHYVLTVAQIYFCSEIYWKTHFFVLIRTRVCKLNCISSPFAVTFECILSFSSSSFCVRMRMSMCAVCKFRLTVWHKQEKEKLTFKSFLWVFKYKTFFGMRNLFYVLKKIIKILNELRNNLFRILMTKIK